MRGPAPCDACAAKLRAAPSLVTPPGLDRCSAVLAYEGAGRELIARLKYRNARATVARLADAMAALVDPAAVDVVTWAPTTPGRRRRRGFDQAELLARMVARRVRRPCRRLLIRKTGPSQTGRVAVERRAGPCFLPRPAARDRRVLLVDDVITTGATVRAGASALRAAGARTVIAVAAARTPLKTARSVSDMRSDGQRQPAVPERRAPGRPPQVAGRALGAARRRRPRASPPGAAPGADG
jgi:predicted amidophosphoribosyltransferase